MNATGFILGIRLYTTVKGSEEAEVQKGVGGSVVRKQLDMELEFTRQWVSVCHNTELGCPSENSGCRFTSACKSYAVPVLVNFKLKPRREGSCQAQFPA